MLIFLIAVGISVMLLVVGTTLLLHSNRQLDELEESYTTIGMVEQKESTVETVSVWDAASRDYTYYKYPVYDTILPEKILDMPGVQYIKKPGNARIMGHICQGM